MYVCMYQCSEVKLVHQLAIFRFLVKYQVWVERNSNKDFLYFFHVWVRSERLRESKHVFCDVGILFTKWTVNFFMANIIENISFEIGASAEYKCIKSNKIPPILYHIDICFFNF